MILPISKLKHVEEINGESVLIRPMNLDDAEIERDFINSLSAQSKHYRFLGGISNLSTKELIKLCDIDFKTRMAFVATIDYKGKEQGIGVSRYALNQYGDSCEFSIVVADQWQNKGLGTLLMNSLIEYARDHDVKRLYSIDFVDNIHMEELAKDFNMHREMDPNDTAQVIYNMYL